MVKLFEVTYTEDADAAIDEYLSLGDQELISTLESWLCGLKLKGSVLGTPLTSADLTDSGKFDYTGFFKIGFSHDGEDYRIIYRCIDKKVEVVKIANRDVVYKSPPIAEIK
ncbi:MAG: hypothetical protein Q8N88_04360 [Nanoarchaeota archaeon]|nr:hypothetical protein [Nanoarchaeota archaeon]